MSVFDYAVKLKIQGKGRRTAVATAPGTCGELVQGTINGHSFLVTCPISLRARAAVKLYRESRGVWGAPGRPKSRNAVLRTLNHFGIKAGVLLEINSPLPQSKGMASSTADIAAACCATAAVLGKEIKPEEVFRLALSLEPTDGIMFPGIVLCDHRKGTVVESLGDPLPVDILVLVFVGGVDTLTFNSRPDLQELNRKKEKKVEEALALVRRGLTEKRPELLGWGATVSALAHQQILPKPHLLQVIQFAEREGAVGVNIAHSGSAIGIFWTQGRQDRERLCALAHETFTSKLQYTCWTNMVSGGVYLEKTI